MKKILLLLIFTCVIFTACNKLKDDNIKRLYIGMSKDEALEAITIKPFDIEYQNFGSLLEEKYYYNFWNERGYKTGLMIKFSNNKIETFYTY